MYVWGASPQALRLQYQARKRAKAAQKQEENENNDINILNNKISSEDTNRKYEATNGDFSSQKINDIIPTDVATDATTDIAPGTQQTSDAQTLGTFKTRSKSLNDLTNIQQDIEPEENVAAEQNNGSKQQQYSVEEENTDHYYPAIVDTSAVHGSVVQVSVDFFFIFFFLSERKIVILIVRRR